eukprot:Gb_29653 [translate_table: standard]
MFYKILSTLMSFMARDNKEELKKEIEELKSRVAFLKMPETMLDQYTDVVLEAGDGSKIKAHRIVLLQEVTPRGRFIHTECLQVPGLNLHISTNYLLRCLYWSVGVIHNRHTVDSSMPPPTTSIGGSIGHEYHNTQDITHIRAEFTSLASTASIGGSVGPWIPQHLEYKHVQGRSTQNRYLLSRLAILLDINVELTALPVNPSFQYGHDSLSDASVIPSRCYVEEISIFPIASLDCYVKTSQFFCGINFDRSIVASLRILSSSPFWRVHPICRMTLCRELAGFEHVACSRHPWHLLILGVRFDTLRPKCPEIETRGATHYESSSPISTLPPLTALPMWAHVIETHTRLHAPKSRSLHQGLPIAHNQARGFNDTVSSTFFFSLRVVIARDWATWHAPGNSGLMSFFNILPFTSLPANLRARRGGTVVGASLTRGSCDCLHFAQNFNCCGQEYHVPSSSVCRHGSNAAMPNRVTG